MNVKEEINYIQNRLNRPEILCQLAEEASELAQAALKLRRALDGRNPTSKSEADCYFGLYEEFADVMVCIRALGVREEANRGLEGVKIHRLVKRLREKEERKCD